VSRAGEPHPGFLYLVDDLTRTLLRPKPDSAAAPFSAGEAARHVMSCGVAQPRGVTVVAQDNSSGTFRRKDPQCDALRRGLDRIGAALGGSGFLFVQSNVNSGC
jgi:hypothetical protein